MTPKITLLDIESSPITGYTWQTYDTSVLKILEPSKILSIAWKDLGNRTCNVAAISDYPKYKPGEINDRELVLQAWRILDEADVVVAHHGKKFDLPKLNAAFIRHGLLAPSSYQVVDTKQAASKYFKFDSNSLNNLGQYLGVGQKVQNGGFDLWVRCIAGDPQAWNLMKRYNKQDVILLEEVYNKLLPYIENHPNLNLVAGTEDNCPSCQSEDLVKRGFSFTKTGSRQRYQCNSCGSWSSGPFQRSKSVSAG